jgi:hypothetical protein
MILMIKALKGASFEMGCNGTLVTCGPLDGSMIVLFTSRDVRKFSMVNWISGGAQDEVDREKAMKERRSRRSEERNSNTEDLASGSKGESPKGDEEAYIESTVVN